VEDAMACSFWLGGLKLIRELALIIDVTREYVV
jgi:hypothetical protein